MGLHLGEAEERGGDYFGPVVNIAARVEAAGHGGQVLITEPVRIAAELGDVTDLGVRTCATSLNGSGWSNSVLARSPRCASLIPRALDALAADANAFGFRFANVRRPRRRTWDRSTETIRRSSSHQLNATVLVENIRSVLKGIQRSPPVASGDTATKRPCGSR